MDTYRIEEVFSRLYKNLVLSDKDAADTNSATWAAHNNSIRNLLDVLRLELGLEVKEALSTRDRLISAYLLVASDAHKAENHLLTAEELAGRYLNMYPTHDVLWIFRQVFQNHVRAHNADDAEYMENGVLNRALGYVREALLEDVKHKTVITANNTLKDELINEFHIAVEERNAVAERVLTPRELAGNYLHFYSFTDNVEWIIESLEGSTEDAIYSINDRRVAASYIREALSK